MTDPTPEPNRALQFYEKNVEFGRKTQAEHSKWLINTLYLLHSGAIAGILIRVPPERLSPFIQPLSWFIVGIALAFVTAFAAWLNYRYFIFTYSELAARARESRSSDEPPRSTKLVALTENLALLIFFGSFACLLVGAFSTLCILKSLPPAN